MADVIPDETCSRSFHYQIQLKRVMEMPEKFVSGLICPFDKQEGMIGVFDFTEDGFHNLQPPARGPYFAAAERAFSNCDRLLSRRLLFALKYTHSPLQFKNSYKVEH
jgi:hypothetical protein